MKDASRLALFTALEDELGPVAELLREDGVTDVLINHSGAVVVRRVGERPERLAGEFSVDRRRALVRSLAGLSDEIVSEEHSVLETSFDLDEVFRVRVAGVYSPVVPSPAISLRKQTKELLTLSGLVEREALSVWQAAYMRRAFVEGLNVAISGSTGSGKTTLLNALIRELENADELARIVTIEEGTRELRLESENALSLCATDDVSVAGLARLALRHLPERVFLGEARGAEVYEWLKLCRSGHRGSALTIHANNARQTLDRMLDCVEEAGVRPGIRSLAETVDLVAHVEVERGTGVRRLSTLAEVSWDAHSEVVVLKRVTETEGVSE